MTLRTIHFQCGNICVHSSWTKLPNLIISLIGSFLRFITFCWFLNLVINRGINCSRSKWLTFHRFVRLKETINLKKKFRISSCLGFFCKKEFMQSINMTSTPLNYRSVDKLYLPKTKIEQINLFSLIISFLILHYYFFFFRNNSVIRLTRYIVSNVIRCMYIHNLFSNLVWRLEV